MQYSTNYQVLRQLLQQYYRPSEDLLSALIPYVIARRYETKEVFLHHGEVQSRICLLIEGAAVAVKDIQGQKNVTILWQQGELILNAQSTVRMGKSKVDIFFLCESKTLEIPTKALYILREQLPEMAHYFDQFLTTDIEKLVNYTDWLRYTPTRKRVKDFQEQYPLHQYLLTQMQKAQYLGMSERWYKKIASER